MITFTKYCLGAGIKEDQTGAGHVRSGDTGALWLICVAGRRFNIFVDVSRFCRTRHFFS
jgi:hypothetical protein